jgi:hypothetical protein
MGKLEREVSASPEEFLRGLRAAFPGRVTEAPGGVSVDGSGAVMEIALVAGPPRAIALLRLPTLRVMIRFTAGTPAQQSRMLARMDRAMHRGGG